MIDEDGIYDPGLHNDRLLLGFKGSMSEAELHWLKSRLLGGKVAKAEAAGLCAFVCPLAWSTIRSAGLCLTLMRPCRKRCACSFLFEQFGSALAVVMYFAQQHLRFPTRWWGRQAGR